MRAERPSWLPPAGVLGAAAAYSVLGTQFEPYTPAMRIATALPCGVIAVFAVRLGAPRRPGESRPAAGASLGALALWSVLIVAAVAFQLALFVSQPRSVYPTFSSLASDAFGRPFVRPAAFVLWLWIGWYLLKR